MKIHIVSDLHLHADRGNQPDPRVKPVDAELLVLAGDVDFVERVAGRYGSWPYDVLYVMGNHDVYFRPFETAIAKAASQMAEGRVRMLERKVVTYGAVRFLGCCLWTDFSLVGDTEDVMTLNADVGVDYRCLRRSDGRLLGPSAIQAEHFQAVKWLTGALAEPFDGKKVVISHHAPHPRSLDRAYGVNWTSASFASDLSALMRNAALWIHGHTHLAVDYRVKRCRVVCNAAGAPTRPNPMFVPDFVVDI